MIPVSYNLRNLTARKRTTLAAAGGLALVVFVLAAVLMLRNGIQKTIGRSADANMAVVLRKGADNELSSTFEEPSVGLVLATPGVARGENGRPDGVGEGLIVVLLDKLGTDGFSNVQIRGVSDNVLQFRREVHVIAGRAAKPGTDEVIVGRAIRGRFKGVDLGQSFDLRKNRPVSVVGIFEDGGSSFESEVWGDQNTVRTAFGRDGLVSSVRVRLEDAAKFDGFKSSLESNRQLNLEAFREGDYYDKQSKGLSVFITALGVIVALPVGIGAVIGAMVTMLAAISNRQREIGTLRALGFSKLAIITSFLLESIVLALAGGVVGAFAATGLSFVKISMMNFATWSEMVIAFEPDAKSIGSALIAAGAMGLLGGLYPAVKAARMNPIEAMRA